jgi:hypothetical protein
MSQEPKMLNFTQYATDVFNKLPLDKPKEAIYTLANAFRAVNKQGRMFEASNPNRSKNDTHVKTLNGEIARLKAERDEALKALRIADVYMVAYKHQNIGTSLWNESDEIDFDHIRAILKSQRGE